MADNARGIHVSPGVYSKEMNLNYAVKSLGITTLGVAGETLKGPAFQPIHIEDWRQFEDVFGGTSPEKFPESQYPKYELPYIAKSYLTQSNQLEVCRVLGLSGYNAGPAWLVTGVNGLVIAVLRSRGQFQDYVKHSATSGSCGCSSTENDVLRFRVGEINHDTGSEGGYCTKATHYWGDALQIAPYIPFEAEIGCEDVTATSGDSSFKVNTLDYGHFKLEGIEGAVKYEDIEKKIESGLTTNFSYAVSLNPGDKDYILNVLGTDPYTGEAPIYVEALYDVAYQQAVQDGKVSAINDALTFEDAYFLSDFAQLKPINGFVEKAASELARRDVGKRFMITENNYGNVQYYDYSLETGRIEGVKSATNEHVGVILTVRQYTNSNGKREYYYAMVTEESVCKYLGEEVTSITGITDASKKVTAYSLFDKLQETPSIDTSDATRVVSIVENARDGKYYKLVDGSTVTTNVLKVTYNDKDVTDEVVVRLSLEGEDEDGYVSGVTVYDEDDNDITSKVNVKKTSTSVDTNLKGEDSTEKTNSTIDKGNIEVKATSYQVTDKTFDHEILSATVKPVYQVIDGSNFEEGKVDEYEVVDAFEHTVEATIEVVKEQGSGVSIVPITVDMNNYRSAYRFASTPWFVSNVKGDFNNIELTRLFRFHTISDGDTANYEVKVSIANVRPDEGTFDVIIRDINDSDTAIQPLESYSRCTLTPGDSRYLGLLIGTYDGSYESKSKYVTVEINDDITVQNSVPCGFLGYPIQKYDGTPIYTLSDKDKTKPKKSSGATSDAKFPTIAYNTRFNDDIKHRRQYFGLSDLTGVDIDLFTFKGNICYTEEPETLTRGFHLDSRLATSTDVTITVDGVPGYSFDAVDLLNQTDLLEGVPMISNEAEMSDSIYSYVDLRKFTAYFYGGFDGWDVYRGARTNTDAYKMTKYKGNYNKFSGNGRTFDKIKDPEALGLNQQGITSDYYAYLAAIRQFANPEAIDINVFATPGIDLFNNTLLCDETIDMIEEERADSVYVATSPDKPYGATDYVDEMNTPDDMVGYLDSTEINSNYTCTYYPWVKYYDSDNYQYINLPVTKDVVRNMALCDNTAQPWYVPAGISRGDVECERAHYTTKIGDEDVLYEGRINPVKTFAADGVKVWGQKNLQIEENQLNRIAVRRLLLRLRKLIAIACRGLIFEPNDNTVKQSFLSTITPILDNIKANRGISDYKIEVNDSAESRMRRELPAKIYFKPINALEYIDLTFVITDERVDFDNI